MSAGADRPSGVAAWAGSWRLALRMARRDARRNVARSLLVAVMVGLPVLAGVVIDVSGRSAQLDPQDVATVRLGDRASAFVAAGEGVPLVQSPDGEDTNRNGVDGDQATVARRRAQVAASLPAGQHVAYRVAHGRQILVGDRAVQGDLAEVDYDDPAVAGWVRQTAGRAPGGAGEVAVSDEFARQSGVRVGDTVVLRGEPHADGTPPAPGRSLRVVGVVAGAHLLGVSQLVGRPGTLLPAGRALQHDDGWFVAGPPVSWEQVRALNALGATVVSRAVLADPPPVPPEVARSGGPLDASAVGIVTVAAVLVLLQITLLAGPALAVGARRNQRTSAVVASAGGSPADLRRGVLASGLVVGLATSLAAVAAGIAVTAVVRGRLEQVTSAPMPRLDLHVADLLLLVAVGTGTALAAALVPAVQAGRQDVVAALAGRRGQGPPRRRVAVAGLVLVCAGLLTALYAASRREPFLVSVGLALGEFGLVALSGTLVVLAARVAPRLPLASRLALRDAARQRGRTAPAVAAVLAVVAGCSAVALYDESRDQHLRATYTPVAAEGSVFAWPRDGQSDATEAAIRATLPVDRVVRLRQLSGSESVRVYVEGAGAAPTGSARLVQAFGAPLVDDGSGLAVLLGRDDPAVRAALSAGRAVVFRAGQLSPDGTLHLRVERGDQTTTVDENGNPTSTGTLVRLPATLVELPLGSEQPVLPASAVRRLGTDVTVEGGAVVASTTRMPTAAQEQRLQAELGGEGYAKVERGHESSYSVFLLVIAIASVVVALGSTLAVVGLSAAEGRADVATLAAVGAPPRVRRRLAAAQAGVVALLGTGLGVLSGVVSGITLVLLSGGVGEFDQFGRPLSEAWSVVVPWRELAALGVVIPLLAVVAAAAFTRSRLPLVRRLGQ